MKKIILILSLVVVTASIKAQKTAYIHLDSVVKLMPELKKAEEDLQNYFNQLKQQLVLMQTELDNKIADYNKSLNELAPSVKAVKENELQQMQERIKLFQQQADVDFQNKNAELSRPVYDKAKKAINEVAKAQGYKSVIDISTGLVLYFDKADDIFLPVLKKLGITTAAASKTK